MCIQSKLSLRWVSRPEAHRVPPLRLAALRAGGPPGPLEGVDVALPSAAGVDAAPHLLLQAGGHGLLGLVGEVDALDARAK